MRLAVVSFRDGRDIHEQSMQSLREHVPEPAHHIVIDDPDHKLGFAGAIAQGWERVLETNADYVLHHEADFLFTRRVPVVHMVGLLKRRPYLTQVALKRQPCNPGEEEAGGIVEEYPDEFAQVHDAGYVFTQHRRFWTTTPSIYPTALCAQGWPQVEHSEGVFSHRLFGHDPAAHSCFWGAKFDAPLVTHIGERAGVGY